MKVDSFHILADSHVHIYDCFKYSDFFDSSLDNFTRIAKEKQIDSSSQNVLLLTESYGYNRFDLLKQVAQTSKQIEGHWVVKETLEDCSLCLKHQITEKQVFLFAGSQIITSEDLEVLSIICKTRVQDGLPLKQTVNEVIENGGLPVLPWGFGKWLGKRGEILRHFLCESEPSAIFLGDNSGRPVFWRQSPILTKAQQRGIRILPGTDPLPFPQQVKRPGNYGFLLEGILDDEYPSRAFKRILLGTRKQPEVYGSLENPCVFFQNQIKMQVSKRLKK